jgi:hypothetical protein
MDHTTEQLLLARLTRIEKQNDEQLDYLRIHIEQDNAVHRVVDRHSVYFSIFSLGIPTGLAYLAKKLGMY